MVHTRSNSQTMLPSSNPNAEWVNFRGTWVTNLLLIVGLKIIFSSVPGISKEISWTLTNLTYNTFTFLFFHWLCGTPFDLNQGEYGALTLWEQIDGGEQFTPTRKFITVLPIFLFLLSTHYSHYDLTTFTINLIVLAIQMIAKLPAMDRIRILGINKKPELCD